MPLDRRHSKAFPHIITWLSMTAAMLPGNTALAQQPEQICSEGVCETTYDPAFFARYAPTSALDMVENLPGFTLQGGDEETRGFGGAAGNILINSQRISAKSDSPENLLQRIPADDVEAIVLIRGQAGGLDLQGQSLVANVLRKTSGFSGTWTGGVRFYDPVNEPRPNGELSISVSRGRLQFNGSVEARRFQRLRAQDERVEAADGSVLEIRDEVFDINGKVVNLSSTTTLQLEKTRLQLNAAFGIDDNDGGETSERTPVGAATTTLFQGSDQDSDEFEIGLDIERIVSEDVKIKGIAIVRREDRDEAESLVRQGLDGGDVTDTETDSVTANIERIGRLEVDYGGFDGHLIEVAVEGAVNRLESAFELRRLEDGILVPQDVPGAETDVEEERVDLRLADTFRIGAISMEAALGAEWSTIEQTGDFTERRSFNFLKPSLIASFAPDATTQWRMRALRQVGQLDFSDFVSAADLGDVELSLGNPNLSPETTVTFDLTYEKRFGQIAAVSITAFHDWIDDVVDLVPLQGILEVPGNIGNGTRSGFSTDLTLPLDMLRLSGGRLDVSARWQQSDVKDPLTGDDRPLSSEAPFTATVGLRQDLPERKLAWGINMVIDNDQPEFGLDEQITQGHRIDADVFVESRAFDRVRIRMGMDNVRNDGRARDRRVFAGPRNVAPLSFREARQFRFARQYYIEVSGLF